MGKAGQGDEFLLYSRVDRAVASVDVADGTIIQLAGSRMVLMQGTLESEREGSALSGSWCRVRMAKRVWERGQTGGKSSREPTGGRRRAAQVFVQKQDFERGGLEKAYLVWMGREVELDGDRSGRARRIEPQISRVTISS